MDGSLGERELDVMGVLWRSGPATVAEVREQLRVERDVELAYNTVLTILRNLESKEFVGHTAEGRSYRYHPAVSEQAVRGSTLARVVEKLFSGSPLRMVAHLVQQETLSADELRAMHELIDSRLGTSSGAGEVESPEAADDSDPPNPRSSR